MPPILPPFSLLPPVSSLLPPVSTAALSLISLLLQSFSLPVTSFVLASSSFLSHVSLPPLPILVSDQDVAAQLALQVVFCASASSPAAFSSYISLFS